MLFVLSAVLKTVDIDPFEIYVYSYHFFSFNGSCIVARLAIILELALGIGLIINFFHKLMWWGGALMLLAYSGLMVYALAMGRNDNCHCFGEILQFNPTQTLLKNLVLLLLFVPLYNMKGWSFVGQWFALVGMALVCFAAVFLVSPPDALSYKSDSDQALHRSLFEEALDDAPLSEMRLDEGKKVVCLFSTNCHYCKMAARKFSLMQRYYGFPEQDVVYVFVGKEEDVRAFFNESESPAYPYVVYEDVRRLLQINDGKFPTVVLLEDGAVVHGYGLQDMDEEEMELFFED